MEQSWGIFSANTLHKHNLIFCTDMYYYQMSFRQKKFQITPYFALVLVMEDVAVGHFFFGYNDVTALSRTPWSHGNDLYVRIVCSFRLRVTPYH